MKELILIKENKIISHGFYADDFSASENITMVQVDNWQGQKGESVDYYNSDWTRKTQIELIEQGLETLPSGYKIVDGAIVAMSQIEKIESGLETMPNGFKIVNGELVALNAVERIEQGLDEMPKGFKIVNGELVEMTQTEKIIAGLEDIPSGFKLVDNVLTEKTDEEKLADGDITQAEYNEVKIAEIKSQLEEIDSQAIRALRAMVAGTSTDEDKTTLATLEEKAQTLRAKMAEYTTE